MANLSSFLLTLKGGAGSGNHNHAGIPGHRGGSAPSKFSQSDINNALDFVQDLTLSGGKSSVELTDNARTLLRQTVEEGDYKLYRGVKLMRFRIDEKKHSELNSLQVGDKVPDYLTKQGTNYTSFTSKDSVARHYSKEGHSGFVMESNVPNSKVVVDLKNLKKVLNKNGISQNTLDEEDFKYFGKDREVIVDGLPDSKIISKYGQL